MRVLVTGGHGVMAQALKAHWPDATCLSHADCDVTNVTSVNEAFAAEPLATHVIHAAAVTDHQCPDIGLVMRTNVLGTANVMRAAQRYCIEPVYLSTHYVYGGEAPSGGYRENAPCDPIGIYAWSKYLGELCAQEYGALIIRGSWYTPAKLERWRIQGALVDAWCSRSNVSAAAQQIVNLVEERVTGIYNIGSQRRTFIEIVDAECTPELNAHFASRVELSYGLPYTFPKDSSVNTDRYNALIQSGV